MTLWPKFPRAIRLRVGALTSSQKALGKYLFVVLALFVFQALIGGFTAHYTIEGQDAVPFIAAQLLGAFAAIVLFRWLLPSLPARELLVPHNDVRKP